MTTKYDLNIKDHSCFICENVVESTDYPISSCELEKSKTSLLCRINRLIGKSLTVQIVDEEFLCQKCVALMDLMNDLEMKLDNVKFTLSSLLSRKFKDILCTSKEIGETCSSIESSNSVTSGNSQCELFQNNFHAAELSRSESMREDSNAEVEEEENMQHICKFCSFSSHSEEILNVHISSEHKEFMCSECHKVFVSLDEVHSHIKSKHLEKWTCRFCDKIFSNKLSYTNHSKLHLKGLSEESIEQIEKENGRFNVNVKEVLGDKSSLTAETGNHQCSFCNYTTSVKNLFDDHIRSHVVLKLFKCEVCSLLFESKALLSDHERSHEKLMYKCGICEKTFTSRDCVINHLREKHKQSSSSEKSDLRHFRRRKQIYSNLLADLNVNNETTNFPSVTPFSSSKSNLYPRCDASSSVTEETEFDKRGNLDVTLPEGYNCIIQPHISEKENSRLSCNFEEGIESESLNENVQSNIENTLLKTGIGSQIQDCPSQITSSHSKILLKSIQNDMASKENHINSSYPKEDAAGSDAHLVPTFQNIINAYSDELGVNSIVTSTNAYSHDIITQEGSSAKYEVKFKSLKIKESGFGDSSASGVKFMESQEDAENEGLWVSLNALVGSENLNEELEEGQGAEKEKPSKIYVCGKCGYKSTTATGIKDHLASHARSKSEKSLMDEEATNALTYAHQQDSVSKIINKLSCSYCAWESPDKLQLRNHINQFHLDVKMAFICRYCKKRCASKLQLIHHEESHGRNKIFLCKTCNKGFSREILLNKHRRIAHSSSKCCFCTKTFLNVEDLSKHKSKHEQEDGYQCLDCPRIFKTKTGLKFHSAQHTGEYKFRCQYCDQGFMSRVVYQEHMGKHTKEERYICDVCGRKFCFQSTYWIHRKWHDTPFPYKCDICERPFRHSSLLKVHKRQHTGERPYHCPHCSRSFSVSGTLKRHLMLHTGEYAFNCGECEKGFTTRNKFALHLSRVHGNDSMLQQGPPKTEFKMVIRDSPKSSKVTDKVIEGEVNQEDLVVENYEELDSMMVQDGGIVGDGVELLKESSLMLPCAILDDVGGSLETRVVEILVNDETSQAVATVTVEGNSSLVSW